MSTDVIEIEPGVFDILSDYVPSSRRAWFTRARNVIKKAGRPLDICEGCGAETRYTQIHHKDHNIKNNRSDNLAVLCVACHMAEHPERLNFHYMESQQAELMVPGAGI